MVASRAARAWGLGVALIACSCQPDTGIWKDPTTNLVWQDPLFSTHATWEGATAACARLQLGGQHDWRLPTISELRTLVRGCPATVTGGSCKVTDSCPNQTCKHYDCNGCYENRGSGTDHSYRDRALHGDVMTSWTSTVPADVPDHAWTVGFGGGHVLLFPKARADIRTRCVRAGGK